MPIEAPSIDELKRLIVESLQLDGVDPDSIGDDDPLFGGELGLDSVDALELIVAMEKRFEVKIPSDQIDQESVGSVAAIHRFILARLATG